MTRLTLGLLLSSCVFAQKITVEFDQAADFTRYRTFAIRNGQLNSPNPALNSELVGKQIESDIERYLMAKGLTRVTGPSDLNVRYTLGTRRNVETEAYPAGWRGLGTRVEAAEKASRRSETCATWHVSH
jgi:Domain of unknown function (DUF4136)